MTIPPTLPTEFRTDYIHVWTIPDPPMIKNVFQTVRGYLGAYKTRRGKKYLLSNMRNSMLTIVNHHKKNEVQKHP